MPTRFAICFWPLPGSSRMAAMTPHWIGVMSCAVEDFRGDPETDLMKPARQMSGHPMRGQTGNWLSPFMVAFSHGTSI